jgi:DNA (cytosine-5)-methyltransferase 1
MLKHLDLFSGIGGFSLGLESAGLVETVAFCDFDQYCQKVLKKNFPGVPVYGDVKELNHDKLKADGIDQIDIITGGYPCQPFSVAGRKKGEEDPRHVWPEMFRLIQELRPTWVIGENVGGHIKLGLDSVLENLESEGYSARTFSISASSIGANHKRERVWIVGYSTNNRRNSSTSDSQTRRTIGQSEEGGMCQLERTSDVENSGAEIMADSDKMQRQFLRGQKSEQRQETFERTSERSGTPISMANSERLGRTEGTEKSKELEREESSDQLDHCGEGCTKCQSCQTMANSEGSEGNVNDSNGGNGKAPQEELFGKHGSARGVSAWWSVEPSVGRVAHGVPDRVDRLKCLGNSVVPQIPYVIGLSLKKIIENNEQSIRND